MPLPGPRPSSLALALAGVLLAAPSLQAWQTVSAPTVETEPATPATASDDVVVAPEELERIKRVLEHGPALEIRTDQLVFYTQVVGRRPMTFAEYARGSDLINGPTPRGNPMTHQEFLDMVTPRELYSSGGITATDLLEFALTSYIGKKLLLMGLDEIRKARDEREAREIRDRIERELAVLRAAEGR